MQKTTFFWFRRDLKLHDNHGLFEALKNNQNVQPLFIFDTNILEKLQDKSDKRVQYIHKQITHLQYQLKEIQSSLLIKIGNPSDVWQSLTNEFNIQNVYCNRDYEPYALNRDKAVFKLLKQKGIAFKGFKDQVIFEKNEILKKDGKPYTVFTPYSKKWKEKLNTNPIKTFATEQFFLSFNKSNFFQIPSLEALGFTKSNFKFPDKKVNELLIKSYDKTRDFPAIEGTSRLSVHLRFGAISIRQLALTASSKNQTFLNELIWRDFYQMILHHFPQVVTKSFKPKYENIEWRNNEKEFKAWCDGKTGYPIVDAGMRELNATGFMHNRLRMITASFLTKHLLIDWRWGEAYFAQKLLDFDLAANNGGWQWAAGTGCDAAPYFRIFNPYTQTQKFDKDLVYVKKWIPELETPEYPDPIVDHKFARQRALEVYKKGLA